MLLLMYNVLCFLGIAFERNAGFCCLHAAATDFCHQLGKSVDAYLKGMKIMKFVLNVDRLLVVSVRS